jgi:hypothetical protein
MEIAEVSIGTAFCLLADISQLMLSHRSGKECAQGLWVKILAFSGENIPILG